MSIKVQIILKIVNLMRFSWENWEKYASLKGNKTPIVILVGFYVFFLQ